MTEPEYTPPAPPASLHKSGREAWDELCREHELADADDLALLAALAHALDREAQARRKLRDDGMYLTDRFGRLYPHPAIAVEAKSRASAAQILGQLQRSRLAWERLDLQVEREVRMRTKQESEATSTSRRGGGVRRHG